MELSNQQRIAYDEIGDFLKSGERVYTLAGYAGTGKTTIANQIAAMSNKETIFCAFTGKAALALRKKGCPAETIHSWLYQPKNKSKQKLYELEAELTTTIDEARKSVLNKEITLEKERISKPGFSLNPRDEYKRAGLIIVDEYSMLTVQLYADLLATTNAKFLLLGDPGQLPPIGKTADIKPDFFLEEVHRQALDSDILKAATFVRENGYLPNNINSEEFCVRNKEDCSWEDYRTADQVLVGHNNSRKTFNRKFREKLKMIHWEIPSIPVKGDKLICLRNNNKIGIFNGMIGYTMEDTILNSSDPDIGIIHFTEDESKQPYPLSIYLPRILNDSVPDWQDAKDRGFEDFDYGYAITCHKAQGSEWDNVLVFHENFGKNAEERKRWLYTAITRASKKCAIVRGRK